MTAKQLVDSPAIRLAAYIFVMGMAYATLKMTDESLWKVANGNSAKIEMMRESLNRIENTLNVIKAESHQQHEVYCLKRREELGCQP